MAMQPAKSWAQFGGDAAEVIPIPFDDFPESLASISKTYRLLPTAPSRDEQRQLVSVETT